MAELPAVELLHAHHAHRSRWRNGLGWTRELHAEPSDVDAGWCWRLSIAEIGQPAAFSRFEGIARELMLLSGDGLTLRFDDGETADLQPPHARLRFDGGRALQGEPAGPGVSVLNLMWRPDQVEAALWHRPLVGTMVVFVDRGDCWGAHVIAGQARMTGCDGRPLERGDTVLLRGSGARRRHVLDGGGELLLFRISPLATLAQVTTSEPVAR
ncbi:hypothetical protein CMZ84_09395 [Lysobacteraceae bacterium NML93-0399]|nr:hypothetical protein CMZ84_09395 [Xanthomonadaceae bacterium NML93-0399]